MNRRTSGSQAVSVDKQFKVSAIVPLFNGEQFISQALESLLSQTQPIDEIIIIDDKSTDRGLQKVQKLADSNEKVKLLRNPCNKGSSQCRNLGIEESSGDYVLFLDQDDYLAPSFIDETSNHLCQYKGKEIAGFHTSYFIVDEKGEITAETSYKEIQPEEFLGYQFVRNRILSNSGTVVKKSVFEQTGLYDESLKFSQDWDLWLRIGKHGTFSYHKKPLTYIRRHANNTSKTIDGFLNDEKRILKKYKLEFIRKTIFQRKLSRHDNEVSFLSILYRMNNLQILKKTIDRLESEYPNFFDHYFFKGLLFLKELKLNDAIESFEMIIPSSNYSLPAQNNIATSYILQGDHTRACKILELITRERPDYQDALKNYALAQKRYFFTPKPIITCRPLRNALYSYA